LFSQQIFYVKVINASTNQGLAFANVFLTNNQKGDATDLDGLALIDLQTGFKKDDLLKCSYIGFRDTTLAVQLYAGDTLVVHLQQEAIPLETVEVTSKLNSSTGKELVLQAIKNIKHNYVNETSRLDAFYRETVYENEDCILINEAIAQLDYTRYPQKGFTKKSWRLYWKDRGSSEYNAQRECKAFVHFGHPQFFKYYNTSADKCKIIGARKSENWSKECKFPLILGGPLALSAVDKVKYQTDFLDPKLIAKYDYQRDGAVMIDDQICLVVRFKPKVALKSVHQRWDKKIGFALFSGTLYLNMEDFAIVKLECQFANSARTEQYRYSHPWQAYPANCSVTVEYERGGDQKWGLKSVKTYQLLKGNSSTKWKHEQDFECVRVLNVVRKPATNHEAIAADDPHLLKDVEQASLHNFPIPYDEKKWEAVEKESYYIPLSLEDLQDLERKKPLEAQFK